MGDQELRLRCLELAVERVRTVIPGDPCYRKDVIDVAAAMYGWLKGNITLPKSEAA